MTVKLLKKQLGLLLVKRHLLILKTSINGTQMPLRPLPPSKVLKLFLLKIQLNAPKLIQQAKLAPGKLLIKHNLLNWRLIKKQELLNKQKRPPLPKLLIQKKKEQPRKKPELSSPISEPKSQRPPTPLLLPPLKSRLETAPPPMLTPKHARILLDNTTSKTPNTRLPKPPLKLKRLISLPTSSQKAMMLLLPSLSWSLPLLSASLEESPKTSMIKRRRQRKLKKNKLENRKIWKAKLLQSRKLTPSSTTMIASTPWLMLLNTEPIESSSPAA